MNFLWKALSVGGGALAGIVAKQATNVAWEKGLGQQRPAGDDTDVDLPITQVVLFAALTAAVSAFVSQVIKVKAAKIYEGN